jgi:hypothetical protein
MRQDKVFRRYIIAFMVVLVFGILIMGNAVADGPGGPLTIWGQVYNKDGNDPGEGYDGAYAAVIIEHNGAKKTFEDPDGIERDEINETYLYSVTIPEGAWKKGDIYWIWIDGTDWGDEDYTCSDHDDEGVNRWNIEASGGNEQLNVDTIDSNFKPILAIIFAIILAVVSIMIGLLRPLKTPFSGRPKQPADLVEGMVITGEAVIPEDLPPEEAAAAPLEERTCLTCNGKLEFIEEYGAWYCETCKKYPDEDELPPPPDDEDLPPPDDEEPPAPPKEGE